MIQINYNSPLKQKHVGNRTQKCNLFSLHSCCRQRAITDTAETRQLVTPAGVSSGSPHPPFSDRHTELPEVTTRVAGQHYLSTVTPTMWGPFVMQAPGP